MFTRIKEPMNAFTHLIGDILSIIGLAFLLYFAIVRGTSWHIVSFSVFGVSLILLYTASTLYHALNLSERKREILHKIDHMMIYVLIAGTYTPVCLIPLRGIWGWSLLISIWGIAIMGVLFKVFWFNAPRWLSTLFYIVMGWLVVVAFYPLSNTLSPRGLIWLISGGILYTLGGIIYGTKWPKIKLRLFGFHEIFHLFVLGGSMCHFWFVIRYLIE